MRQLGCEMWCAMRTAGGQAQKDGARPYKSDRVCNNDPIVTTTDNGVATIANGTYVVTAIAEHNVAAVAGLGSKSNLVASAVNEANDALYAKDKARRFAKHKNCVVASPQILDVKAQEFKKSIFSLIMGWRPEVKQRCVADNNC